ELVGDVFQYGALVEVLDREHRLEDRLDALVVAQARTRLALQELLVRSALNLDQVRHLHGFGDAPEAVANALLAGKRRGGSDLTQGETVGGLGHSVFPIAAPCEARSQCSSHGAPTGDP